MGSFEQVLHNICIDKLFWRSYTYEQYHLRKLGMRELKKILATCNCESIIDSGPSWLISCSFQGSVHQY